jgi:CheY-like chemotaxis protein
MAAGLAHEINNPLSFVTANLRYALDGLPKNPARQAAQGAAAQSFVEVEDALREAEIGGKRIAQIVSSLQTFVRQPDPSDSRASPAEARRWALNITQLELRRRARVVTEIADLPQVRCNETRLSQVFINLLLNAAQAIPPGGPHEHRVSVVGRVDGDGWVVVEVSDTGEGIAPAVLGRIFEPFFTTREIGQGAGLGLSISHAIVESAGGQLTATSEVGRGSTFRVRLPVAPGQQKAPAGPGQPGRRRILVIDDEPMILRLVQRILADEHQVTTLDSAEKALVLLAEGARFDVIICDLMMPGLNGIDLHSALVRDYPDQVERIVFISGGATSARTADFLAQFPDHQLEKPFNHAVLRAMISRIPALPAATNPPGA